MIHKGMNLRICSEIMYGYIFTTNENNTAIEMTS